ncbi:hypothetical protein DFA_02111 [Cavenderia fasciculata]|uniref:Uncharacterized protein n=1 Tax=Cavenderia fasciculata TaxID=261658 RepID=F4PYQ8_CACFS|nr:uncharacterized protein DFA_02111 [Cavenderia fasciculata]EGG19324.1 hypothetical protein DFA_02111 [Cavenderia fasciculata]|eukprot:XP_004357595.1 hypothetical protein DFA_02111 [Cavenderia fasciculata]
MSYYAYNANLSGMRLDQYEEAEMDQQTQVVMKRIEDCLPTCVICGVKLNPLYVYKHLVHCQLVLGMALDTIFKDTVDLKNQLSQSQAIVREKDSQIEQLQKQLGQQHLGQQPDQQQQQPECVSLAKEEDPDPEPKFVL